jgi:outer membrane protein OmpA-like peptidoglycan-associated protein
VDQVLIEEMGVRELAGKPARFEYAFTLREYITPPAEETEEPPPEDEEEIDPEVATLEVEVEVEGDPNFDFSTSTVTVEGTPDDGDTPFSRTLTNRTNNIWRDETIPSGRYTVRAVTGTEPALAGSVAAVVHPGQTTRVKITLQRGQVLNIATTFVVHFRFDKAFVEPCMRRVLKQVANYADSHPNEKLLILGHTDKVGSPQYNQSLSERRARIVYAYLTMHERTASLAEWSAIRERRPTGEQPSIKDTWDVREYQHILQDLGFYPGAVDGDDGPLTREAVRAYRCHKGLPPGTTVDSDTWLALIEDYLSQDNLSIQADRFLPNCNDEIVKWLGCGEEDPVHNTGRAWRPNRRTELLFIHANSLPCQVPQPDTFDLPAPGSVNSNWCAGPAAGSDHCCFVTVADPQRQGVTRDTNAFIRTPIEPGTFTVEGLIQREQPDGTLQPVPNQAFVLTTPIGEFKGGEQSNGEPSPARTDANGQFSFADLPGGFYSLEIITPADQPVLARPLDEPDARITGNVICRELHVPSPGTPNPRLDVVIVNAPVLREIRLPVVAHLMIPLNSDGTIRTCTSVTGASMQQHTIHTDSEIREFFDGANSIWRKARIRFELANIVREAYVHPIEDPAIRGNCQVDDNEFAFILSRCMYPDVVNVFFFGDFAGTSEAGKGVSVEDGVLAGVPPGCAVADRFQFTILGVPNDQPLDTQQSIQVLAHELGHYLNLPHTSSDPADEDQLMFPNTRLTGNNTTLLLTEVSSARGSRGAIDDCVPLTLHVTGATQIGGTLSNQFIVVQDASAVVTIDAQISDRLITFGTGTLTMAGGTAGANPKQQIVSAATTGLTEIVATYTPTIGGQPVTARVVIRVVTFTLRVEGATQSGGAGGTEFFAVGDSSAFVNIHADIAPAPFSIPVTLITWNGGNEVPDPLRRTVTRAAAVTTTVTATLAGTTRSVIVTVIPIEVVETPTAAAVAVTFVRFGIWDAAYDAAGEVKNNAAENDNFVGSDKRKFHIRIHDPAAVAPVQVNWKTLHADNSDDDAPASQVLTLIETPPGSKVFISKGIMLVTDNIDRDFPTHSGFTDPAADAGNRNFGESNHRTRRASLDGFVRIEYAARPGVLLPITLPVFDRAAPFMTISATNVSIGSLAITPTAMSGTTATGARWSIKVGMSLTIDTGANQEETTVTAVTPTTFTANFAKAHDGTAAPFQIVGQTDERRRLRVQVVRYNNPADPTYLSATDDNIREQFEHAEVRWRQTGLQVDRLATQDRNLPAGALNAAGRFPFSHPDGPQEQAVLADLLPITPDNTLTVVFIHTDPLGGFNAYAAILPTAPVPLPAGGTATMDDRFFIFINSRLNPNLETLPHELHHVLFNRGDAATLPRFFTFNTNAPLPPLPDVRKRRRIHTLHSADVNADPNNDNTFNWQRRERTGDRTVGHDFNPPPTASTGNRFTEDF